MRGAGTRGARPAGPAAAAAAARGGRPDPVPRPGGGPQPRPFRAHRGTPLRCRRQYASSGSLSGPARRRPGHGQALTVAEPFQVSTHDVLDPGERCRVGGARREDEDAGLRIEGTPAGVELDDAGTAVVEAGRQLVPEV